MSQPDLPPSLPSNWPNPTAEDLDERPLRKITINGSQRYSFITNFITTSKYTSYTFLPKFLAQSFHPRKKMANVYFFIISCMQCIPIITNTHGIPTVLMPLSFVIIVDGIFAALEDLARHKADADANASKTKKYDKTMGFFEEVDWASIGVGDFVKISNREVIPADVVILAVKEKTQIPEGRVYVETKSLDGETNLKMRRALKCTMDQIKEDGDVVKCGHGEVEMEHPNKLIDSFKGTFTLSGAEKEVIDPNNVLLRGCTLRNVDWAITMVVNTGLDTKIMMSNSESPVKLSSLEQRINVEIKRIVFYLAAVCFLGAIGSFTWKNKHMLNAWYLKWTDADADDSQDILTDYNATGEFLLSAIVQFFYYFLLMANFVPVSLYVSMSTVKFFQAKFIEDDLELYHAETDTPTKVRTMALNEELGQISHVFSDKTGTLTCNIMDFRKCTVNGISYGKGITEIGKAAFQLQGDAIPDDILAGEEMSREHAEMHKQPHVNFYDQAIRFDLVGAKTEEQATALQDFFTVLALCHSVIPEHDEETGEVKFSASSPDDEALVCGAKFFGFDFIDRKQGNATLKLSTGEEKTYKIMEMIEFNSDRKRMSVVVKKDDCIELYSKGADTVMIPRLKGNQEKLLADTCEHMTDYAKEGLRTLMICKRTLDPEWFERWHEKFKEASTNLAEIEKRLMGKRNKIDLLAEDLEKDLMLLGASAIEDKLQDGVPGCIADLAKAGIKIWVLTGDKVETAINIAVACRLLHSEEFMQQVIICAEDEGKDFKKEKLKEKLVENIREFEKDVKEAGSIDLVKPRALIIDGPALILAMDPDIQPYLLRFTQCCKAVVGCRVSPDQKRQMVNMVKTKIDGVKTLAIGDGANDVAMIQAAHVGIGISGQEGMQAVNASDYAIAQFKFLRRLLLIHGRWNYRRMSRLVCYIFYKNIVMAIVQFWYAFQTGFSGQKFYFEGGIQLYNIAYTCFPIMLLGVFDQDVEEKIILMYPQLYNNGIRDAFFNSKVFFNWILAGTIESMVISIFPLYALDNTSKPQVQGGDGLMPSLWMYGATSFTLVVLVTNFKLLMNQYTFPWFSIVVWLLSVGSWFLSAWGMTSILFIDFDGFKVYVELMKNQSYWLCLLVVCVALGGRDFFYKGYQRAFHPQLHHVLQEMNKFDLAELDNLQIPLPPAPHMYMKERLEDLPEHIKESENVELLQIVRRATRTASDLFLPKGLGHAYEHSDLQTVIEERNIVLGRSAVKTSKKRMSQIMFGGKAGPAGAQSGFHERPTPGKITNKKSFGEGLDFWDDDSEGSDEEDDKKPAAEEESGLSLVGSFLSGLFVANLKDAAERTKEGEGRTASKSGASNRSQSTDEGDSWRFSMGF
ncbi:hypothetical protein TrLO_g10401 [Triparma laevis f. longispina]|uniref:Phospholipid-transporting ATPase n=1 Tax=Triparma laevis f. longispina TaxID=1714387 RepID=A0A9W7FN13_9STRA|nr:hypothetical protein TrLO_g10401 [Triparma laevis f. longispina]